MHPFAERYPRLWGLLDRIAVVLIGGMLFWCFSLLVITIPAALVGSVAGVAGLLRPVEGEVVGRFWRAFRRSFGTALLLGLIDVVSGVIAYAVIRFYWAMGTTFGRAISILYMSAALVVAMANIFAWPLLAWFPQPIHRLLKRSVLLAAAHPFFALGGLAGLALYGLILGMAPPPVKGLLAGSGPGVVGLISGWFAWKAMQRYAGPEDEFTE